MPYLFLLQVLFRFKALDLLLLLRLVHLAHAQIVLQAVGDQLVDYASGHVVMDVHQLLELRRLLLRLLVHNSLLFKAERFKEVEETYVVHFFGDGSRCTGFFILLELRGQ